MKILKGQRSLITGGAAGIGEATALALAAAGSDIAILDVDKAGAAATVVEVEKLGVRVIALSGSVADSGAVDAAFEEMDSKLGPATILVNNAGISGNKPTLDLTDDDWNRNIGVNLDGVFFCSRAAGRRMKEAGGGCIVNVGSIYALVAPPNRLHYAAPKAAVEMMTRALAVEWSPFGIRVNGVAPGYVKTQLLDQLVAQGRVDIDAILRRTPQRRLGTVEEVADAILYLCEPRSSFITGHMLPVDGGWVANGFI